jgi:hypothetical protein
MAAFFFETDHSVRTTHYHIDLHWGLDGYFCR